MDLYSYCIAFTHLKMYPVFETVHFVLMTLNIKRDLLSTVPFSFERRHPLASWVATMMLCFAGGIINCILFARPLANVFAQQEKILIASAVWYIINYIPGVFDILASRPGMTVIICLKEIQRVYGVYGGVNEARELYQSVYLLYFIVGFLRGSGAEIMMYFARMTAGVMKPNSHQFLAPNVVFKASALLSLIFVMEAIGYITVDHNILFTVIILTLVYFRLCMVWGIIGDPFVPFENLVCSILFGGMWEAYLRVKETEKTNASHTSNGEVKVKRS